MQGEILDKHKAFKLIMQQLGVGEALGRHLGKRYKVTMN